MFNDIAVSHYIPVIPKLWSAEHWFFRDTGYTNVFYRWTGGKLNIFSMGYKDSSSLYFSLNSLCIHIARQTWSIIKYNDTFFDNIIILSWYDGTK